MRYFVRARNSRTTACVIALCFDTILVRSIQEARARRSLSAPGQPGAVPPTRYPQERRIHSQRHQRTQRKNRNTVAIRTKRCASVHFCQSISLCALCLCGRPILLFTMQGASSAIATACPPPAPASLSAALPTARLQFRCPDQASVARRRATSSPRHTDVGRGGSSAVSQLQNPRVFFNLCYHIFDTKEWSLNSA